MRKVKCAYGGCFRLGSSYCEKCENNGARNEVEDHFRECRDNDISNLQMIDGAYKAERVGTAEQGGYKCPACGHVHNAYTFEGGKCENCGLPLRIGG